MYNNVELLSWTLQGARYFFHVDSYSMVHWSPPRAKFTYFKSERKARSLVSKYNFILFYVLRDFRN